MIEFPLLHPEVGPEKKYRLCKVDEKFHLRVDLPSGQEEEHLPCMLHLTEVQALWQDPPVSKIVVRKNILSTGRYYLKWRRLLCMSDGELHLPQ